MAPDLFRSALARAAELLPGTRERREQTARYRDAWLADNADALAHGAGRRWVAVGDSTSQGIGASSHTNGWVGQVLEALRADGGDWHVVNLSVTGARIGEVLADQLPRLDELEADLVTVAAGANDLLRGRTDVVIAAVDELLHAVPDGCVLATLPQGIRPRLAKDCNARIVAAARARGLRVADVWHHTGPPWSGKYASDGFHPNDVGYREWTAAFCEALDVPVPG